MSTPEPPPYPSGDHQENSDANSSGYPPPPPPPVQQPGVPPQYGTPQYGAPQYGMPGPTVVPGSSKATTSLITGIISLFCCGIVLGVVAIVTGKQATTEAAAAGLPQPGNAKAGVILGWIGLVLNIVIILGYIALFALGAAGSFTPSQY